MTFRWAGHIVGSATVDVNLGVGRPDARRLVFSGDLGRWDRPIIRDLRDPEVVPHDGETVSLGDLGG